MDNDNLTADRLDVEWVKDALHRAFTAESRKQLETFTNLCFEIMRTPRNSLVLFDRYFDICEADVSDHQRDLLFDALGSRIS